MKPITASQHHANPPHHSLVWFVAVSLLLHLAVLLGMQREQETLLFPAAQTQTAPLALHLRQAEPPATTVPAHSQPQPRKVITTQQPSRHRAVHTAPQPPATAPALQQAKTPAAVSRRETAVAETRPDSTAQLENLRVTLQRELTRYFTYPLLARRRGWQGEVILAFRLDTDGTIINARVARSSGYGVLDRAALNALGRVRHINQRLQQQQDMQLPVIYRLQEG